jgi:hypothetical protein
LTNLPARKVLKACRAWQRQIVRDLDDMWAYNRIGVKRFLGFHYIFQREPETMHFSKATVADNLAQSRRNAEMNLARKVIEDCYDVIEHVPNGNIELTNTEADFLQPYYKLENE